MAEAIVTIERDDWEALTSAFAEFFAGAGEIAADDQVMTFEAAAAGTGLELRRDGTSSSFMSLHGLDAR